MKMLVRRPQFPASLPRLFTGRFPPQLIRTYRAIQVAKGFQPSAPSREDLFELIIDSSTDFAIFTTDVNGITTSWSIGAKRLFGYDESEIVGSSADVIFVSEDRKAGAAEKERVQAVEQGRALDERWH